MTALAGDQTADTSGQVINLNMNTTFKCVPHILGSLQFLQTVAELCADAHYYFAHSSIPPALFPQLHFFPQLRFFLGPRRNEGKNVRVRAENN